MIYTRANQLWMQKEVGRPNLIVVAHTLSQMKDRKQEAFRERKHLHANDKLSNTLCHADFVFRTILVSHIHHLVLERTILLFGVFDMIFSFHFIRR